MFWLATEDHDFAEINHVTFPSRRELKKLVYETSPRSSRGGQHRARRDYYANDGAGVGTASVPPTRWMRWPPPTSPGRTFAQAFAEFYGKVFAAQGLLILDAGSRAVHRMGAPVLRAGIERADELHAALVERNQAWSSAGYHAQVAVPRAIEPAVPDRREDRRARWR